MISVHIKISERVSKTIDIEIIIPNPTRLDFVVQLPAWRPGRYEMQNFAKNISTFKSFGSNGLEINHCKITKDSWKIAAQNSDLIKLHYSYYVNQMDAGGSYTTNQMLYVNFINCIFYVEGRIDEPYEIKVELPETYKIACGLKQLSAHTLFAHSFYELVDSPMVASDRLQLITYEVAHTVFNVWIEGHHAIPEAQIIADFKTFTQAQYQIFKSFPFETFHFLLLFLPYRHYHGVEHHNSTVIVLGPDDQLAKPEMYKELLGISCHELFHAWNALKIKPKELTPYDYTKENYFETGFVLEGLTTYYGDYLLGRSGVWSVDQYMFELNAVLKREFDNFGSQNASLSRSSVELWLDGYVQGIPNRKVSIYTKGCLFALLLDLTLRELSNNRISLDEVMLLLWERFGKQNVGYSTKDIIDLVNEVAGQDLTDFFEATIFTSRPLEGLLHQKLNWIGCGLTVQESKSNTENYFGFRTAEKEGKTLVDYSEPGSLSDKLLAKNDELIAINGRKINGNVQELMENKDEITLTFFRDAALQTIVLHQTSQRYFKQYVIQPLQSSTSQMQENFKKWLF
jgi:predicted metalloprotease with PDZ domain